MTKVYRLWCEWDIGTENLVFITQTLAKRRYDIIRADSSDLPEWEKALEEGLIGVDEIELISG